MRECRTCGAPNPSGARFCASCGAELSHACPYCGAVAAPGLRFCGACGRQLPTEDLPAVPPERRLVTVLFADIVGFSTIAEELDPEELHGLVTEPLARLAAEVEKRGGLVEKYVGDAVLAVFGSPAAHDDDPERAVEAAVAMMEVTSARGGAGLGLRIGVNAGVVVAGGERSGQAGVLGDPVNVAARLQQSAEPGEILVADVVWRRVRHRFRGSEIGAIEVKGREQPVVAHRILGPRSIEDRALGPFVGRADELALLELLWSSAAKGNTHVVSIVGEPGVGKSRLLAELAPRDDAVEARVVCSGERAFGPFLELLSRMIGRIPEDVEGLKQGCARVGVDEETAVLVGAFLGLGGAPPVVRMADEQQRRQVFAGVWRFLSTAPAGRPALIVLDDVHWADRSSLDLLGFLLERVGGQPLLLILAYRPGFEHVERAALRASHTAIRLEPLQPAESLALARGYLGVQELPENLEDLITSRAEGNPFFVEELLQALLETEALEIRDGKPVLTRGEVDVPHNVQGTILARIDRLPAADRELLQHAAVIGRSFSSDLLERLGPVPSGSLESLARAQLLVPVGPKTWAFKHGMIQEVAYETLLRSRRRELHLRVVESLEATGGDDPFAMELLAEHSARAESRERARRYAVMAGDLAAERMGFVEARQRYEAALGLWGQGDPEGRLNLQMKLGKASLLAGDLAGARTAYIEAEAGWRTAGDSRRAGEALANLGRAFFVGGEPDRARAALGESIALLEPDGPSPELVRAHMVLSQIEMVAGMTDIASAHARRGLELEEGLGLEAMRSQLLNTLGSCEVFLADPAGIERLRRALDLAVRAGDAEALGRAYANLPYCLGEFAQLREGIELSSRGRAAMQRLGAPGFEWFIASNQAALHVELGEYETAVELCNTMLTHERSVLGVPGIINALGPLATVQIRRGELEAARRTIEEALPLARRVGGAEFLSWALMLEAELEEVRGNVAVARRAIAEALEVVAGTPSLIHMFHLLVPAARLLGAGPLEGPLGRVRPSAEHPAMRSRLREAEGWLGEGSEAFREAAELYAGLEMPYQEARCRIECGDQEHARAIVDKLDAGGGPLGMRLADLRIS